MQDNELLNQIAELTAKINDLPNCPHAGLTWSPRALGSGVSRPTVWPTPGGASPRSICLCGIDASVVELTADWAEPFSNGEVFRARPLSAAGGAELGGRIETVYCDYLFPIPLCPVLQLPAKLTQEASEMDRAREWRFTMFFGAKSSIAMRS